METKVEKQTQERSEFKVGHYKHSENDYSLSIQVEDRHVLLGVYSWTPKIGYHAHLDIYGLTPDDIQRLGELLITEALKIKAETT